MFADSFTEYISCVIRETYYSIPIEHTGTRSVLNFFIRKQPGEK